jgi:membrane fusion protein (multidrug efflux system)
MLRPSLLRPAPRQLTCLALALCALAPGCGRKAAPAAAQGPAPAVLVAPVVQKTVPVTNEFVARTDATATVDLVARVEGVLQQKSFEEGRRVRKNQVLYRIEPSQYEANRMSAQAKVAQSEAQLKKADQDVARYTPLAASHAIPQQDLDTALTSQLAAKADLQAARAALVQADLELSYCTIKAPFDGVIGHSLIDTGNLVGRGSATVLDTVSSLDPIKASFAVPEAGYLTVAKRRGEGISLDVQLVLADGSLYPRTGRVTFLDRAVDLKTGTFQVYCEFPNPEYLIRPNQFGRVRVVVDTAENALLVPQKAVLEEQGAKAVYVVGQDNKVTERMVTLGPSVGSEFVVKAGLQNGDRVIVEGQQKARPGMVVAPTEQPASAEPSGS